ncbi:hypothetical protein [Chrysodeixis includens nucleopolyhedrovirus]|nr:hypothetical protein [Chrysodeixis includens nucleopolyhedrovirus]
MENDNNFDAVVDNGNNMKTEGNDIKISDQDFQDIINFMNKNAERRKLYMKKPNVNVVKNALKRSINEMKDDVSNIKKRIAFMETQLKYIKEEQQPHYQRFAIKNKKTKYINKHVSQLECLTRTQLLNLIDRCIHPDYIIRLTKKKNKKCL